MSTFRRFEEIDAWQTARVMTKYVYQISEKGPLARDLDLRRQMRRAAVSVMSNIAEGFESRTRKLFIDFLGRAKGSSGELRSQGYVALDTGAFDNGTFEQLLQHCTKCSGQVSRLIEYLESHPETNK